MTVIIKDNETGPFVDDCSYINQQGYCDRNQDFWDVVRGLLNPGLREWFYDESGPEDRGPCPPVPESTSTKPPEPPKPTPSPLAHPIAKTNQVMCNNAGDKILHVDMDKGIEYFCRKIGSPGDTFGPNTFIKHVVTLKEPVTSLWTHGGVPIRNGGKYGKLSLQIQKDCEWNWNFDECTRYFRVNVDSCNCEGVNGKQGGRMFNNCLATSISTGESESARKHDEL